MAHQKPPFSTGRRGLKSGRDCVLENPEALQLTLTGDSAKIK